MSFNKGVLMEKIPYLIANSLMGDYDENNSYNWAQWKEFNSDMILGLYIRKPSVSEMKPRDYYEDLLRKNLDLLTDRITAIRKQNSIYLSPLIPCSGGIIFTGKATRKLIFIIWNRQ